MFAKYNACVRYVTWLLVFEEFDEKKCSEQLISLVMQVLKNES
jgi:hypothetical protein